MKIIIALLSLLIFSSVAQAEVKTFGMRYNRFYFDTIQGLRLYMGDSPENIKTLVADIKKADITVYSERPFLIKETFDTDPGTKYPLQKGSWKWAAAQKNMQIDGPEFMVVFEVPAGVSNDFSFFFWPKSKTGSDGLIYSYLKDETGNLSGSNYYELRLASGETRFSNWRKVVNSAFGGVEGAFALPRFSECSLKAEGETICPGFPVSMAWRPGNYTATWNGVGVEGKDETPLNIQKLEIIITDQSGWIDNIIIGGQVELRFSASITFPSPRVYFAASFYSANGEGEKSLPVMYDLKSTEDSTKKPPMPGELIILN